MVQTQPDTRPRVLLGIPSGGGGNIQSIISHCYLPGSSCQIIPIHAEGSAALFNHNVLFAEALKMHRAGIVDYLVIHHADVEILTHRWLDIMVEEQKRTGAALLSVVCSKKTNTGHSNMAISTNCVWLGRVLMLQETWDLPGTFCITDTNWPARQLLVNTGLMLIDLARPEWWTEIESTDGEKELKFCFRMHDRIKVTDGELAPQFASEDWNFSRYAAEMNLPVYATTKIQVGHHGAMRFNNWEAGKGPDEAMPDMEDIKPLTAELKEAG